MATKTKAKIRQKPKPKSLKIKIKSKVAKAAPRSAKKASAKVGRKSSGKSARSVSKRLTAAPKAQPQPQKVPSKQFAGAVAALEVGIKLMYAESYEKAIRTFNRVIADYAEEPEIQASAKARIQACEKKLHERGRTVYRSADDHYNVGIALLNRGELESAIGHLQHALKLAPKSDHVLYAMAAANALQGNKDQALTYLKQSIHHRPENRFQAVQDRDFAALIEEPAFKELVTPADKVH
jgi:tetratricopeptide (TPR) repeat protein